MADFLVIDRPSAYNAIIGRPTLNKLRAMTSTYHLKMKFLTNNGVGGLGVTRWQATTTTT